MNKRIRRYAFLTLLAAGLSSCAREDFWDTFDRTIDGPIDFTVGIELSPAQRAKTRATDEYSMANGTQVLLKVDGAWNKLNPATVSKTAICTTSDAALSYVDGQTLYWDDYGAGDPNNSTNTTNGLSVLGVAVDGNTTAPTVNDWTSLPWSTVDENGNAEVNTYKKLSKDIIVSNNLTTYKFSEKSTAGNLKFTHPLSKITFYLVANQGFPTDNGVGQTDYKFASDPVLTLTNATSTEAAKNNGGAYALTEGKINIQTSTATVDDGKTKKNVIAKTTNTESNSITVVKEALVYPGTLLGASDDKDVIAQLNADDNIYYIKAGAIRKAMRDAGQTDYMTVAGNNYIIRVTINKSGIYLSASVSNWEEVISDEVDPIINVDASVGISTGVPAGFNGFAFYRSENIEKDYVKAATPVVKNDGSLDWSSTTALYWSSHNQHYHFRGIYPTDTKVVADATDNHQYVVVTNGSYDENSFPSNFVMGMPEFGDKDYMCNNEDHTSVDMRTDGICARTSAINLNFRYMMSQVEVNLTSSESTAENNVDLTKTKVELVNVGNDGHVLLSDRSAVITDGGGKTFELPSVNSSSTNYLGVIIPQTLVNTNKSNKVKFKITVYDDVANTYDVYYADVAPIKVKQKGSADEAAATDKWESGIHYVYNLKITMTEIKATATLTDWTTVEAAEDVWF